MDNFTPKPQALDKAKTFLRKYHDIALKKYPNFIDQLPLFYAKPRYDPPVIHFSPAQGGFDDDFLVNATDSTLAKTARDWLDSQVKRAIPPQLLDDIVNGDCIIFLGAGASTEGLSARPSLVNIVANKCGYPKNQPYSLPLISQYFCDSLDGGQRSRLVRLIRSIIDEYMKSGETYRAMTTCHSIIAKIPQFRIIVTTNWDILMERLLNVIAVVRDEDMVYWNDQDRQVIKIHGCITQPSTMVITKEDYDSFVSARLNSPIANKLADLMATKTFLFIGYSLEDPDFEILHNRILAHIGKLTRHSFAVMPKPSKELIRKWKARNITIIPTTGEDILKRIHDVLIRKGLLFSNTILDRINDMLENIGNIHLETRQSTKVGFASAMYQDGLQHELEAISNMIGWGFSRAQLQNKLDETQKRLDQYKAQKNAAEIAYWTGRTQVILWVLGNTDLNLEPYFSARHLIPIDRNDYFVETELID